MPAPDWNGMVDDQGRPVLGIDGFCPMGCGETLVSFERKIVCAHLACPNSEAVSEVLANPETEHIVRHDDQGWSMQHPLRERVSGRLFDCAVFRHLSTLDLAVRPAGLYRVTDDATWALADPEPSDSESGS